MDWIPLIAGVLVALVGNGAALLLWRSQKDKLKADASSILTAAAMNMVQRWERRVVELEKAVEDLKKRVRVLETENECLRDGAEQLENQVESLGQEPVWRLPEMVFQD